MKLTFFIRPVFDEPLQLWLKSNYIAFETKRESPACPDSIWSVYYTLKDCNAIDFLALLYDGDLINQYHPSALACIYNDCFIKGQRKVKIVRKHPLAVLPYKKRKTDVGYDITIIGVDKKVFPLKMSESKAIHINDAKDNKDNNTHLTMEDFGAFGSTPNTIAINTTNTTNTTLGEVFLYETGLIIQPCVGYYAEIVPRSSLSKTGYALANSVGIIDGNYLGTIKIPLRKVSPDAQPITFPFTCCQLIIRRQEHVLLEEVEESDLLSTSRMDGGFGSTGSVYGAPGGPALLFSSCDSLP